MSWLGFWCVSSFWTPLPQVKNQTTTFRLPGSFLGFWGSQAGFSGGSELLLSAVMTLRTNQVKSVFSNKQLESKFLWKNFWKTSKQKKLFFVFAFYKSRENGGNLNSLSCGCGRGGGGRAAGCFYSKGHMVATLFLSEKNDKKRNLKNEVFIFKPNLPPQYSSPPLISFLFSAYVQNILSSVKAVILST